MCLQSTSFSTPTNTATPVSEMARFVVACMALMVLFVQNVVIGPAFHALDNHTTTRALRVLEAAGKVCILLHECPTLLPAITFCSRVFVGGADDGVQWRCRRSQVPDRSITGMTPPMTTAILCYKTYIQVRSTTCQRIIKTLFGFRLSGLLSTLGCVSAQQSTPHHFPSLLDLRPRLG